MKPTKKEKQIFWDYDLSRVNMKSPFVKKWYLARKLFFGDLTGIKKADLKKYLKRINVDPSLKELLNNFIRKNAKN